MNNNINSILQMLGANPQAFLQNQIKQNPQIAQLQTQLTNMQKSSGMSEKDFAMQYAKQNNIPENVLMELATKLGIK